MALLGKYFCENNRFSEELKMLPMQDLVSQVEEARLPFLQDHPLGTFQKPKPIAGSKLNPPISMPRNRSSQEIKRLDSFTHYQHEEVPQSSAIRPLQQTIKNEWELVLNQTPGGNKKYSDLLVDRLFTPALKATDPMPYLMYCLRYRMRLTASEAKSSKVQNLRGRSSVAEPSIGGSLYDTLMTFIYISQPSKLGWAASKERRWSIPALAENVQLPREVLHRSFLGAARRWRV